MLFIDSTPGLGWLTEPAETRALTPLERARAQLARGVALRRAGRDIEAREPLRLALDLAHRCGATELEEEALAELRAAGARPRRRLATGPGALTPGERRVAELAAAGRMNREIAQLLWVTMATVEYHLRQAYRKLGIASRAELGDALGIGRRRYGSHAAGFAFRGLDLRLV